MFTLIWDDFYENDGYRSGRKARHLMVFCDQNQKKKKLKQSNHGILGWLGRCVPPLGFWAPARFAPAAAVVLTDQRWLAAGKRGSSNNDRCRLRCQRLPILLFFAVARQPGWSAGHRSRAESVASQRVSRLKWYGMQNLEEKKISSGKSITKKNLIIYINISQIQSLRATLCEKWLRLLQLQDSS